APPKFCLLMAVTICIIRRDVCFNGVSSAYLAQPFSLSGVWHSVQFKLRAAAKNPIVSMNSSTGMPLRTWTFLNTSSTISGFCCCPACALADSTASTHTNIIKNIISVEYLRHRECKNGISIACRYHNLFVNGIDLDSVHVHPRDFSYRDSPVWRDISVIVDTPNTDCPACGGRDNPTFRRVHVWFAASEFRLRTRDDPYGFVFPL